MSKLEVDKITPQSGTTLTIGEAGDTTVVNGLGTLPATIGSATQVLAVNAGATGLVYGTAATDLSNLNATNLTSGTVPDGRFPSVLPAAGAQNLTSLQPAAIVGGTFGAINSANLTNLNATALTSGTLPDGRFPSTLPAISGANLTNLPAAGADMEHISTTTVVSGSTVSSVDFSNVFTTTYKHYRLIANNVFTTVNSLLQIKLQIGGSYNTSNYYVGVDSVYAYADTQVTEVARGWNAGLYNIHPNYSISNASNPSMFDTMFYAPKDSAKTILNTQFMLNHNNLTATVSGNSSLLHNSASSVTGFQIFSVSGQIGGIFSLYGIKN